MRCKIIMKTRVRDIISYLYKTNKILRAVINRTKLKTQHFITQKYFVRKVIY